MNEEELQREFKKAWLTAKQNILLPAIEGKFREIVDKSSEDPRYTKLFLELVHPEDEKIGPGVDERFEDERDEALSEVSSLVPYPTNFD